MIHRTNIVLQMNDNGRWQAVDNFDNAAMAEQVLAQMPDEDPWHVYRLKDRSYDIPDRHAGE